MEMVIDANDDQDYQRNVQVLEGFVECMTDDGASLNGDGHQGDSALSCLSITTIRSTMVYTYNESVHLHRIGGDCLLNSRPTTSRHS